MNVFEGNATSSTSKEVIDENNCAIAWIEEERSPSESNTQWNLRRSFLYSFKDDFPEDRLRSMSMIFCNVIFLNCSYGPKVMKMVDEFSKKLHNEVQIAKGIRVARKCFSLPILDSDEEEVEPVSNIADILSANNEEDVNKFVHPKKPTSGSDELTTSFSDMLLDNSSEAKKKKPEARKEKAPRHSKGALLPGVFHISVLESSIQQSSLNASIMNAAGAGKKNKKKKSVGKNESQQMVKLSQSKSNETTITKTKEIFLSISTPSKESNENAKQSSTPKVSKASKKKPINNKAKKGYSDGQGAKITNVYRSSTKKNTTSKNCKST